MDHCCTQISSWLSAFACDEIYTFKYGKKVVNPSAIACWCHKIMWPVAPVGKKKVGLSVTLGSPSACAWTRILLYTQPVFSTPVGWDIQNQNFHNHKAVQSSTAWFISVTKNITASPCHVPSVAKNHSIICFKLVGCFCPFSFSLALPRNFKFI